MWMTMLATLTLFSHLDNASALAHPARAAILGHVRARPGETIAELARVIQSDYKTAEHHVRALAHVGRVRLLRDGRNRRVFETGAPLVVPPAPRAVRVLHILEHGAGAFGPADIARLLGIPRGTAGSLLDAMARRGLAVRDPAGGWRASAAARAALVSRRAAT